MSKLKKGNKPRSPSSLQSMPQNDTNLPSSDMMLIKILSLRLPEEDPQYHAIKVAFFDQLLVSAIIKPLGIKDKTDNDRILAKGTMMYDPSDYEKMCLFADKPLTVHIQPLKNVISDSMDGPMTTPLASPEPGVARQKRNGSPLRNYPTPLQNQSERNSDSIKDISCCNIDILPLFLDTEKMCIKKRMQPMMPTKVLLRKSWDNLPLLKMGIQVIRNEENAHHHRLLEDANWMKLTVVESYNMLVPFNEDCYYIAASKTPIYNDMHTMTVNYSAGLKHPRKFDCTSFYPRWETLQAAEEPFTKSDDKLSFNIDDIHNPDGIDLNYYLTKAPKHESVVWGSFHRSLVLGNSARWHWKQFRKWKWPIEVQFFGDTIGGQSLMGFMDLFPLLYPGVSKILVAVPLHWYNPRLMMEKCNCGVLLAPNEKAPVTSTPRPTKSPAADSTPTATTSETGYPVTTGANDFNAFVLVEVQFSRPLVQETIPPYIRKSEIEEMLTAMEDDNPQKRECSGRGQTARDWQVTVKTAASALRRVPHHGLTEFCNFNRQLSETRTRVELLTSFWMDAAIYVNNNFIVQNYLETDQLFEELLMMSHVCLMKLACDTLVGEDRYQLEPALKAARHARQLNDLEHALEMYLQVAVKRPFDGDTWREVSTCLRDIDRDWASVCLDKALMLDTRHPLTLLAEGCMVFEEDPDAAEPFFDALLCCSPFWSISSIVAAVYYNTREYYRLADEIMKSFKILQESRLIQEIQLPRAWEKELGDFWEPTLILPGMSPYLDAADLLLRIRAIRMAEACLGLALAETGESVAYYHLVALCFRLQGDFDGALCLARKGMQKYGPNTCLLCLEGECLHQNKDQKAALECFEKANGGTSGYSILLSLPCWDATRVRTVLVDLLRRQPSAYGWMALANDWLMRIQTEDSSETHLSDEEVAAQTCAAACAVQALNWDRRAGRAWAILAKLVKPNRRRLHCAAMALDCGFVWLDEDLKNLKQRSQESVCHQIGRSLRECRCDMCEPLKF